MRIHWFTPLPPARTEIANHSVRVLPDLSEAVDLTVWTHQETWDPSLNGRLRVRRFTRDDLDGGDLVAEWNGDDAIAFYNLGNNVENHGLIHLAQERNPGVVVAHDTTLYQFLAGYHEITLQRGGLGFLRTVAGEYGREARSEVEACMLAGEIGYSVAERIPCTRIALRHALGVIHHGPLAPELEMEARFRPFVRLNLPYRPTRQPQPIPLEQSVRTLLVFGFLAPNRRLESILQALRSYPRRERLRLEIVGHVYEAEGVRRLIAELGLKGRVAMRGFLAESDLQDAIDRCSLVLNLRHPTCGEASAAALRTWEHARPSLVTPVGWYAEQPEGVFLPVRPDHERVDLHGHFDTLLDRPEIPRKAGMAGRALLEARHGLAGYVESVVAMAAEARRYRATAAIHGLFERIVAEVAAWTPSGIGEDATTRIARIARETFVDERYQAAP